MTNSDSQSEQELVSLNQYIQEKQERFRFKYDLRQKNLNAESLRLDDSVLKKLDSSIKKVTSFIKRLKTLTESQKDSLKKDMNQLNLSKYLSEVAAAFLEAKLKMNDVNCALILCSQMHQSYGEFSAILFEQWQKILNLKKDGKIQNPSKLRVDLRFFADLISSGVLAEKEALSLLGNQLTILTTCDKEHANISIVCSFCKHCGEDFADLVPLKYEQLAQKLEVTIARNTMYSADRQKAVKCLFKEYFASVSKHLVAEHKEIQRIETQNTKIYQTKGELHTDKKEKYEQAFSLYKKLTENSEMLADLLGEQMPSLPKDHALKKEDGMLSIDVYSPCTRGEEFDPNSSPWEDEETRQFYESLPQIKSLIPEILYKDTGGKQSTIEHQQSATTSTATPTATATTTVTANDNDNDNNNNNNDAVLPEQVDDMSSEIEQIEKEIQEMEKLSEHLSSSTTQSQSQSQSQTTGADNEQENQLDQQMMADDDQEDVMKGESVKNVNPVSNANMKALMDSFVNQLPNCVSRELIDKAAKDFCLNLNTKLNRKRLTRALFEVQRTRLDLLPFYARFVATLSPVMPEIAADLATLLLNDFRYQVRKKDQINIESKIKVSRFIGELVKFDMLAKSEALNCLKTLLADFRHHNIEMLCNLVEVCGRYLYRNSDTHIKMNLLLEILMRKKQAAVSMDNRYTIMIENAFYYCNPPENKQIENKIVCPLHDYVKRLLYKELNKLCVEKVLRQMRKLDWHDDQTRSFGLQCLTSAFNVRYNSIHCLANLVSGLALYYEQIGIEIVDAVIEDIRLGLELNLAKFNQRRVSMIKYLAELYNYRMVESSIIFKTLYTLITYGVTYDLGELMRLGDNCVDPLDNYIRIRLVCTLLDTCGQYFDRGSTKKKLDCYLLYFQRYYMFKKENAHSVDVGRPFDRQDIEFVFTDTIASLRPQFKFATTYQQACEQVDKMEGQIKDSLSKTNAIYQTLVDRRCGSTPNEASLATIAEDQDTHQSAQQPYRLELEQEDEDDSAPVEQQDDEENQDDDRDARAKHNAPDDEKDEQEMNDEDQDEEADEHDRKGHDSCTRSGSSDVDDTRIRLVQPKKTPSVCREDEEFLKAFETMVTENIAQRTKETIKMPTVDITVPMFARKSQHTNSNSSGANKPLSLSLSSSAQVTSEFQDLSSLSIGQKKDLAETTIDHSEQNKKESFNFVLMLKKGNKTQYQNMQVPVTSQFATQFKAKEQLERAEKQKLKQLTLNINDRIEQEEFQEMVQQSNQKISVNQSMLSNTNRDRFKYNHPKGAPDADQIFGTSTNTASTSLNSNQRNQRNYYFTK